MRNIFKVSMMAIAVLLMAHLPASAQQTTVLGYCPDDIPADAEVITAQDADARISAAIRLPRQTMLRYKGGQVTKIRIGIKDGLTSCSVWLRHALNERSAVQQSVHDITDGWNEVELSRPLEIDGEDLYVGFTAQQPAGVESIYHTGDGGTENTSWLATGNEWADYHTLGLGCLFIQAVVEADNKTYDLAVTALSTPSLQDGQAATAEAHFEVANLGAETIEGFRATFNIDGQETGTDSYSDILSAGATVSLAFTYTVPELAGRHVLSVSVQPLNATDEDMANNTAEQVYYTYAATDFRPRNILLEHFTSIPCVNCPEADALLEEVVKERNDVVWTSHHVGYRDDELTIEASRPFVAFGVYGNPEIVLDRRVLDGSGSTLPAFVINMMEPDEVAAFFDQCAQKPAFLSLQVEANADDGTMAVSVTGEAAEFVPELYPGCRLNVFLVEDQVTARQPQAGKPTQFVHDNITRAILTGTNGNLLTWEGNRFSFSASTPIAESWKAGDMRVVAFVTLPAEAGTNFPTGEVLNAAQCHIDATTGLTSTRTAPDGTESLFDIQGRRIERPVHGIYIESGRKLLAR